ncbi:ABC transporter substrate-binding protein [uncultured Clostridium sp.]|uniref:ABC transporter substrate-binding protein n=1 Tax=uncultured Clostridium sp. TaxID=59620 RepID=UPI0025E11923|nr:ABC transporter substrate-binding protein [uncultured Clostridium sp.]
MIKRKKDILKICTLLLTGSLFLTGCSNISTGKNSSNSKSDKITITDSVGREVTLENDIDRIVLVRSRDIFELEVLLGEEMPDKIVGWSDDLQTHDADTYKKVIETFPEMASKPSIGNNANDTISAEAVLALEPDLVLMNASMAQGNYDYAEKLEEANLPIVYLDSVSDPLSSPQESIALLGKILGKQEKADELVNYMNEQVNTVMSRLENIEENSVSAYMEIGNGGPSKIANTFGSAPETPDKFTSWGVILDALKVNNIAEGVSKSSPLNSEYILEQDPDVIVITGQGWEKSGTMKMGYYADAADSQKILKSFTTRTGWNTLSAVKNNQVYSLYHGFPPHVFAFAGVQGLAKAFYPDVFEDLNPTENLKKFYDKFMPEEFSGEWFMQLQ